ncbi:hypothetical protein [uncultured Thiothrix sp.]|uniref:hypothetical protein n=1 Tax=uncultured Thiothrix sp. TaxID=223185 RepID=UPI00261FF44E|nr:hypothetical protein [uncultured Thiothrix sp.]
MVRTTSKPQSVEQAKARLRANVAAVDYLAPLRTHPLPLLAVGLVGGFVAFRALKKGNIKATTGLFELGVAVARKLL